MPITAISAAPRIAPQPSVKARPQAAHPAPRPELPEAPKPLTPANAAVHIMKVPSSRVLEAFVSLQRALGQQAVSDAPPPQRIDLLA
jgi:hypothetical protein